MTEPIEKKMMRLMGLIDDFGHECSINGDDRQFTNNDAEVTESRAKVDAALRFELTAIAKPNA